MNASQESKPKNAVTTRETLEFGAVWVFVNLLKVLPRGLARWVGAGVGRLGYAALGRLRKVGIRNLELAFPEKSEVEREQILRREYRNLGWLLAEFCQMPKYTAESASRFIRYEGLENYLKARDKGQGGAGADGAPGGVGAFELLSLADGDADGDGDSAAG